MITNLVSIAVGRTDEDTLVTTNYGYADQLDPAFAYNGGIIQMMHVYETLVSFDKEKVDEFIPVLATTVPTTANGGISADGLTYTFTIREDVKFSNGNDLTPEDVEYSFERMLVADPDQGPIWMLYQPFLDDYGSRDWETGEIYYNATDLQDIVEVDGNDVIFNLAKPFPSFLQVLSLSTGLIIDKEWAITKGCWDGDWNTWKDYNNPEEAPLVDTMMGTGPYKLDKLTPGPGGEVIVVENEDYWGTAPKLKRIHWKFIDEWSTRKLSFLQGDIDILGPEDPAHVEQLRGEEGVTIIEGLNATTTVCMIFNFNIAPDSEYTGSGLLDGDGIPIDFFNDTDVRLGFAYAFPYETLINDTMLGQAIQLVAGIPNNIPYFNPDQEGFSYDKTKATQHFQQAWDGEVWENGFTFQIPYDTEDDIALASIDMLAESLEDINSKFVVEKIGLGPNKYYAMVDEDYPCPVPIRPDGWWWPDFADPDNFYAGAYLGDWGYYSWNMFVSTSEIEDLIATGSGTLDKTVRRNTYYELQELYVDEALGIPLFQVVDNYVMRDYVEGYYYRPLWQDVNFFWYFDKDYGGQVPGFALLTGLSVFVVLILAKKSRKLK